MIVFLNNRFSYLILPSPIVKPLPHTPLMLHSNAQIFGTCRCTKSLISLNLLYLQHWSMAKNTQTVMTIRMSPCPTPYLNSVARKVVTLLKTSFCYTFLCIKSFISFHLLHLRHWSIAKNTQTVKTNRMSPCPTPTSI